MMGFVSSVAHGLAPIAQGVAGVAGSVIEPNHRFKPLSMDIMREMIYSKDSDLNSMELKDYDGEITPIIESMLDNMYKLTVLSDTMKKFPDSKNLSHVQPYHDTTQHFRCYLSDSYIVVEVSPEPERSSGTWKHIIENHGADEKYDLQNKKGKSRYYNF